MAIIIDGFILFVPKAIIGAIVITSTVHNNGNGIYSTHLGLAAVVIGIVFAVIDLAYFGYLNGSPKGQTVGQMALGIAVRDEVTGGAIGTQRAAVRILVLEPAIIVGWLPVIGLLADLYTIVAGLSPLWDGRRQGFHDKVAKTDVIKVR